MPDSRAARENQLGTQPIKSMIWKFAIPGIISQLVNSAHNIVDQIFVGWGIGDTGIAATNIAFPLSTITTAMSVLLGLGAVSRFSILLGKENIEDARKTMGNSLALLVLSGTVVAITAIVFLEPMLYVFGATDLILPYARPYALIISIGVPLGVFATGMSFFIRADGNPNYSSMVLLSGALFNIIFDPVFLFVFDMGIAGIALATMLGQLLSTILALLYLLKRFKSVSLVNTDLRLRLKTIGSICSLGIAPFATHILMTIVQIIQMNTLRHYGALSVYGSEIPIAVTGAIFKVLIVLMACIIGISLGCQPIYGFNYGAKKYDRVKKTYMLAIRYGTTVSVAAFILLRLFPGQILSIFGSENPLFFEYGTRYINTYLIMTFANAIQPVSSTFFTSMGKAHLSFWAAVIRQGILLIPLMLVLPFFWGIDGFFLSGPISDFGAVIIVISMASREIKKLTKLQTEQNSAAAGQAMKYE